MRKDTSPKTTYAPASAMLRVALGACLFVSGSIFAWPASAQAPTALAASPAPGSTARPVHRHKHPTPHALAVADPVVPVPIAPPAPPKPNWPAFDQAAEASVVWDSHGLTIDAANSSLEQILKDFSTATGAKVEGLSADQRVFGAFGPAPAREVLSQVLQGSGYNVIMIGDLGQGAPRQILLSVRQAGPAHPGVRNNTPSNDEDDVAEEPPQPTPPEPISNRPGFPPGGPPRSPQQIMQEMQERQQQLQQQQQQQQNPQN
jgi:hypothetical protein